MPAVMGTFTGMNMYMRVASGMGSPVSGWYTALYTLCAFHMSAFDKPAGGAPVFLYVSSAAAAALALEDVMNQRAGEMRSKK